MAQVDYIHFLPSFFWVFSSFLVLYYFFIVYFCPEVLKIRRVRTLINIYLLLNIIKSQKLIQLFINSKYSKMFSYFFDIYILTICKKYYFKSTLKCI